MPRDMTSVRHDRLLKIMALLQSRGRVSSDELQITGEYNNKRTLQNIVAPKSRTKKGRRRDKVKFHGLRDNSYILRGVRFPSREV